MVVTFTESSSVRLTHAAPLVLAVVVLAGSCAVVAGAGPARAPGKGAPAGLLSQWRFERERLRGRTFQPLTGRLAATVVGPVQITREPPESLVLDGNSKAGHRVDVTDDLSKAALPSEAISVEAWVMPAAAPRWSGIIGAMQDNGDYEKGWLLGSRGRSFAFAVATAAGGRLTYLQAARAFEIGYWYHVVGTYDGRAQRLYVDGGLAGESDVQRGPIDYPPKAYYTIGAYRDDNELHAMAGRIEQVSVFGRALSAGEVRRLFAARKGRFPGIEPARRAQDDADWPTYLHDGRRSGWTASRLALPLRLQWVRKARLAPQPAWPPPARHDYWHYKRNLKPRVIYDRAFHLVAAGEIVCFGSSADDKVYCLDAATGRQRWSFFTGGPVRLAPTIADGKVLFGSDDGWAYCLRADDGSLLWRRRLAEGDRRIPGNGRVMSLWPVRTGVLVADGAAHFCAGLFPVQGVYRAAADLRTGRLLARERVEASAQGYLAIRSGRIFAPTGRDPAGTLMARLKRRGKFVGAGLGPAEYPCAFIGAGGMFVAGGRGKVAVFDANGDRRAWQAAVDGRAYSLAVARGRLLVGTDKGTTYCFAPGGGGAKVISPPKVVDVPCADAALRRRCAEAADRIIEQSGTRRGYCLLLGSAQGRLAWELARRSELRIVGIEPDAGKVAAARRALNAAGLYGRRVAIHHGRLDKLPYTDYLFNVVAAGAIVTGGSFGGSRAEAVRVLRPGGGVALLGAGAADVVRRAPLDGAGEWTHMFAEPGNTACSGDRIVGGPMTVQWFGRPGPREQIDRHHRNVPPLYKDGRLFVPGDEIVTAVDPYNGTILWRISVPASRRLGVFLDCGSMAVDGERLYVAAGEQCLGFDVRTGRRRAAYAMPPRAAGAGGKRSWGYVARTGRLLVGSERKARAGYREVSREADDALWYDHMKLVTSDGLFAVDAAGGKLAWQYRSGVILNTTIALSERRAFFVASRSPAALADELGRMTMPTFLPGPNDLVALDLRTGKVAWKRPVDLADCRLIAYLNCSGGHLVLSGCKYVDGRLWYFIHGIDAATGEQLWRRSHNTNFKPKGGHGEQNRHPTIVGETVYAYPLAYNLRTGKPVEGWRFSRHGHGCGNLSASGRCLFWRGNNPWMWPLGGRGAPTRLDAVTRPGCFINIIPAGGLVLVPEASSGCTCNYPMQASIAFRPARPDEAPRPPAPKKKRN